MSFIPHTDTDRQEMLARIGVERIQDLFHDIPADKRYADLDLPEALSEMEAKWELGELSAANIDASRYACFLGAGAYNHYVPSVVDYVLQRGEFYTAYTPYQPEISQGTLQAIFEYQSLICALTGMDVANASHYDGATSLAEAVILAINVHRGKRNTIVLSPTIHPEYRQVVRTYMQGMGLNIIGDDDLSRNLEGLQDLIDDDTAMVAVQNPDFFGRVADLSALAEACHAHKALLTAVTDPISLGMFKSPGEMGTDGAGADIVVGEGQSLGGGLNFGGPYLGFFATRQAYVRRMAGRLVGETTDAGGQRGYVLTLATREQHIRREKATSNICTNQGLLALAAAVYLAALGRCGLPQVASLCYHKSHYAAAQITALNGYEVWQDEPFFKEFVVKCPRPVAEINQYLLSDWDIIGGYDLGRDYAHLVDHMLVAVTETNTREEIDDLVAALQEVDLMTEPLIYDLSAPGRCGVVLPDCDVPEAPLPADELLRDDLPLPEVSEIDIVRHYLRLSQMNHAVDKGFYPLGSCTMKYNPKINEQVARLPGFASVHPYQDPVVVQGAMFLTYTLQEWLKEIAGFAGVSLQPSAGAQGEMTGVLMMRKYLYDQGETQRNKVLIPDSAHGTNPATTSMSGLRVVQIPSDARGNVDLAALEAACDDTVIGLMLTNPNTLGLFEEHVEEIIDLIHGCGGLVYGDGANLNAILGITKPGDLGFDVLHFNLHKTFSTPHGGGGPGSGPVGCVAALAPYLPGPIAAIEPGTDEGDEPPLYTWHMPEKSIGRVKAFHGNFGMLVRTYTYIRMLGSEGLRAVGEHAVLNANYLRALLQDTYPVSHDRTCMHEFVLAGPPDDVQGAGVHTMDVAKRLMDFGFHPPTVYFPLIVPEALMIEPTETESKETLDAFAEAMIKIVEEARANPEILHEAPHNAPVRRLDEVGAARHPVLCCTFPGWEPE